jgi:enediyne biosynthesis protein E4
MIYAKDVDKNGFVKLIPAYYIKDNNDTYQLFPALDRNQLAAQVPSVKKKYLLHKDYSTVTMAQLSDDFGGDGWTILKCETAETMWLENLGNGKFTAHALPIEAQFAPVNSILTGDIDGDGKTDIMIAGNEYQADVNTGRYDASYGLLLEGNGKGGFVPVNPVQSGIIIDGDVKDMKMMSLQNKSKILLVAPNDSKLKTFLLHSSVKER